MASDDLSVSAPAFDQPTDYPTRPDLVLGIFPPQSTNLLAGDPYVGKTRLMLCEANHYRETGIFIGRRDGRATPALIGMICRKHDLRNIQKVIKSCQLSHIATPQDFPIATLKHGHNVDAIVKTFEDFGSPKPSVLFIDIPIQSFAEGNINEAATADAVHAGLREFCHDKQVTIWITALTVKRKTNEGYARSAQAISGSGGWTMADVTAFLDLPERCPDETTRQRRLLLNAHHDDTQHKFMEFSSLGTISIVDTPLDWEEILANHLAVHPDDRPLFTSQIKLWGIAAHISQRSIERWIREMHEGGVLICTRKGAYRKAPLNHA